MSLVVGISFHQCIFFTVFVPNFLNRLWTKLECKYNYMHLNMYDFNFDSLTSVLNKNILVTSIWKEITLNFVYSLTDAPISYVLEICDHGFKMWEDLCCCFCSNFTNFSSVYVACFTICRFQGRLCIYFRIREGKF